MKVPQADPVRLSSRPEGHRGQPRRRVTVIVDDDCDEIEIIVRSQDELEPEPAVGGLISSDIGLLVGEEGYRIVDEDGCRD